MILELDVEALTKRLQQVGPVLAPDQHAGHPHPLLAAGDDDADHVGVVARTRALCLSDRDSPLLGYR